MGRLHMYVFIRTPVLQAIAGTQLIYLHIYLRTPLLQAIAGTDTCACTFFFPTAIFGK